MKKFLAIVLVLMLMLSLAACGGETSTTDVNTDTSSEQSDVTVETDVAEEASGDEEWRQFLADYEVWVDEYVALMEKYNDNPTDPTLITDYTTLAQEALEWSEKAESVKAELENNPEALKEYSETLASIAETIASVAN